MTVSEVQREVIRAVKICGEIHIDQEVARRVGFLADYLSSSGASGYVLAISGGVDSAVAGRLGQLACEQVQATFTAMRLPYGVQADEADAQTAVAFTGARAVVTVDIRPAVDAMMEALRLAEVLPVDPQQVDFVKGNIKARQRMVAQYAVAGSLGALVIGTDHAAEAVMGFFTKFGDGACDIAPLAGLTKGQVRELAEELGAPRAIIDKTPTADLEDDRPGLPDEACYGCTYDQIDDYLQGRPVPDGVREIIESAYRRTLHKRALPITP